MADRENGCLTQKYTKFRFEDSLRKYQPPPRKRVKIDGSTMVINATESNFNPRLIRLCETRRLYHATSRERASEFSRKKQAHQESTKKNEQVISDFDGERDMEVKICESVQKQQKASNVQMSMEPKSFSHGIKESELKAGQFTPPRQLDFSLKQSCQRSLSLQLKEEKNEQNKSMSPMSSSSFIEMEMQKSSMIDEDIENEAHFSKQSKVKDIQFHIALVEQIHLRIVEEYQNLEKLEGQVEHKQDQMDVPIKNKQLFDNHNFGIAEVTYKHEVQEIKQQKNVPKMSLLVDDKGTVNICSQAIQISKTPTGRFHIYSSKGACLFSARIFSRLCQKQSPNRITNQILKHHPYLSSSREILQKMAKDFEE